MSLSVDDKIPGVPAKTGVDVGSVENVLAIL